jgi:ribosome recycling factor
MIEETLQETEERMGKTITDLKNELKRVRTGRASYLCWTASGWITTAPRPN